MKNLKGTSAMVTSIVVILALATPVVASDEKTAAPKDEPVLKDQKAKSSYAVGVQMGKKLKGPTPDLDADLVARGVKDVLTGAKMLLTEEEMKAALEAARKDFRTKQAEVLKQLAEKNKKEGEAFLAENKTKEGVVTLKSGLQYKVLKAGDGKKPAADDTVVCHYRGTLIDGTEFDSSLARSKPATFPLKQLIKGWAEALQLMPVGSKWQLFIPPGLAYGEKGPRGVRATKIGPNATLIFEVELISIQERVATADPAAGDKTSLKVSFKLDPRVLGGSYGGERWVSPPTYTTTLDTVEARVAGVDPKGGLRNISVKWTPSDPEMVTVSPSEGNEVKISVKRAGISTLKVAAPGVSKQLSIKATVEGNAFRVEITQ
jgi:FKBP-type peptidyl-prolyl cis-trans isomerase